MAQPPGIEPGSTVLQTVAMTTSAKVAFGIPPETRTPTNGFGDRYAAITSGRYYTWRRARESNSKGAINTRRFSRPLPSPVGLALHYN